MNFTCPYCGNGSFVLVHDGDGSSLATCGKCAKVIPFEKYMMTNSSEPREASAGGQTDPNPAH
jgi:ribosomal protein S27AE